MSTPYFYKKKLKSSLEIPNEYKKKDNTNPTLVGTHLCLASGGGCILHRAMLVLPTVLSTKSLRGHWVNRTTLWVIEKFTF